MDQPSLYDDDIVTWAEQQAASLHELARRPELSNRLDWENVAAEIESVGPSQISAVENLLAQTLAHLIKQLSAPDTSPLEKLAEGGGNIPDRRDGPLRTLDAAAPELGQDLDVSPRTGEARSHASWRYVHA